MIEKWNTALDRMCHLHAVAEEVQDVGRKKRFGPDEKRLVQRIAPVEHARNIEGIQEEARTVAALKTCFEGIGEQAQTLLTLRVENLEAGRHEAEQPLHAMHRAVPPSRTQQ